jgi:hypothetical protein
MGRHTSKPPRREPKPWLRQIRKLATAGFVSASAIARELNEREIPAAFDGKWEPTSVKRLLQRLERLDSAPNTRHRR